MTMKTIDFSGQVGAMDTLEVVPRAETSVARPARVTPRFATLRAAMATFVSRFTRYAEENERAWDRLADEQSRKPNRF